MHGRSDELLACSELHLSGNDSRIMSSPAIGGRATLFCSCTGAAAWLFLITSLMIGNTATINAQPTSAESDPTLNGKIVFSRYGYSSVPPTTTPTPTPFENTSDIYTMDSNGANVARVTFQG